MSAQATLPLDRGLRKDLERTVREAREVAEAAARAALEHLGVGQARAPAYLDAAGQHLRRRLRSHGRQLGDSRDRRSEAQEIEHLVEEVAYEYWHRMLFARFLAETELLMLVEEDGRTPITLEECEDLAPEHGARDGWDLAARLAARMLPQIFRPESPVFDLELPPERKLELERLLLGLPAAVFSASDSLGWVYQFWQAKRKEEVKASETKIGARELPAVTQLFTEPYMVAFLLDNTLGAWWASRRLTEADLCHAANEKELREKARVPGLPLEYLRIVRADEGSAWRVAAGNYPRWPETLGEFRFLDPCCGSGHFVVAAFHMLVPMRMELEGLSREQAVEAVLAENLHGLEIDARCVELAAFHLAFAAWRLLGEYRDLPRLHLACSGVAIAGTRDEWTALVEGQGLPTEYRYDFGQRYDLFRQAPTLGSLINPDRILGNWRLGPEHTEKVDRALREAIRAEDPSSERHELGVAAAGLLRASELLSGRYTLVATNVPYLGRGKQDEVLKAYLEAQYPLGNADLATAFVLRCLELCETGGSTALVTPQNWLFLSSYTKLRKALLEEREWHVVARLGEHAFDSNAAAGAFAAMAVLTASLPDSAHMLAGVDVSAPRGQRPIYAQEKAELLRCGGEPVIQRVQAQLLANPDCRILIEPESGLPLLSKVAHSSHGIGTFDSPRFCRNWWEVEVDGESWVFQQSTPSTVQMFGGCHYALLWEAGIGSLAQLMADKKDAGYSSGKWRAGIGEWGRHGVLSGQMDNLPCTLYLGQAFDDNASVIVPESETDLPALWAFCSSEEYCPAVRKVDSKVNVTCKTLVKVQIDIDRWRQLAASVFPTGLPEPESNDPTQWIFHGRPEQSDSPLQVSLARLVGYRWPAELDPEMRLSERARSLVRRCDELLELADDDGIVCIPPVRGERAAADRLLDMLARAYGDSWTSDTLPRLLETAGYAGKTLDVWLREAFFKQHCELFQQRPFVWHVWDGLRDGFSALVNYHRLDGKNLERLIYTYLGDWIRRQKTDLEKGVDGAQERLDAATSFQRSLKLVQEGEAPYDVFVRWKPLSAQPMGWEPDLDDGVRLNLRPFLNVPDVRSKGSGVLRVRPKVDWKKDRGKEPRRDRDDFPWFWVWDETQDFAGSESFDGVRHNDCHYTLEYKRKARERAGRSSP